MCERELESMYEAESFMKVKLWGVRGSLPSPVAPEVLRHRLEEALAQFGRLKDSQVPITAAQFVDTLPIHLSGGYGGNTTCAEVNAGGTRLLIDAGSGLRPFADWVMHTEPACPEYHMYFTHFHWDHLIGLPFFPPMYIKGKTIHVYGCHPDLEAALRTLFQKPFFPVPYEVIRPQVKYHLLEPYKRQRIGEIELTPYKLDHPDPCWGARIEHGGKSLAWAVDTECNRLTREEIGADLGLYQKADLLVFDAQYSFLEGLEKINWGHSSGPIGIDLALREAVKQALFVHHDPAAPDEAVQQAEEQTRHYYQELVRSHKRAGLPTPELNWRFAREGETVEL